MPDRWRPSAGPGCAPKASGTTGPGHTHAPKANPYQLTTRQLEVLELVRAGLTTVQIAARLHISPKTADHHVTAILAKMNVRSRADAARQLCPEHEQ